jgi:hypothetical protein
MVLPPRHDSHRTDDRRIPVVVYPTDRSDIVAAVAGVLGRRHRLAGDGGGDAGVTLEDLGSVVGMTTRQAREVRIEHRDRELVVVIYARCADVEQQQQQQQRVVEAHEEMAMACDHEFVYSERTFSRRVLARFVATVLRQTTRHCSLVRRTASHALVVESRDLRALAACADAATLGADAVRVVVGAHEARHPDEVLWTLMELRRLTDLPVVLAVEQQASAEGCHLLERALRWGVEFVSVSARLPEAYRQSIYERRGNTCIIAELGDVYPSQDLANAAGQASRYGDIVQGVLMLDSASQTANLDECQSSLAAPGVPLSLVATTPASAGKLSYPRTCILAPVTHPLLPRASTTPGLATVAHLHATTAPANTFLALGSEPDLAAPASLLQKLARELGLAHRVVAVEGGPAEAARCLGVWQARADFGGAVMAPTVMAQGARVVDAVLPVGLSRAGGVAPLTPPPPAAAGGGDSAPQRVELRTIATDALVAALTRETAPSAYLNQPALVVSDVPARGLVAVAALTALGVGEIHTHGFAAAPGRSALSAEDVAALMRRRDRSPFVVVSAGTRRVGHAVASMSSYEEHEGRRKRRIVLEYGPGAAAVGAAAGCGGGALPGVENVFGAADGADVDACVVAGVMREVFGVGVGVGSVRAAMACRGW